MPGIETCLSPALIDRYHLKGKIAVVVDVLRATSCMTAGIASGIDHILPFADVEECRAARQQGYLVAGERGGEKIPGFDIGNSPFEYMDPARKGLKIATTTTNGTRSIHLSAEADEILIGSFLNLGAVVDLLRSENRDLIVICAGWRDKINLEDSLFAGAVASSLGGNFQIRDDSTYLCRNSYEPVKNDLEDIISRSEHAQRLAGFDLSKDIAFCSKRDKFDVVPAFINGRIVHHGT